MMTMYRIKILKWNGRKRQSCSNKMLTVKISEGFVYKWRMLTKKYQNVVKKKWGFGPSFNCKCGASDQIADHVLTACPIHWAPHGTQSLMVLDDKT